MTKNPMPSCFVPTRAFLFSERCSDGS